MSEEGNGVKSNRERLTDQHRRQNNLEQRIDSKSDEISNIYKYVHDTHTDLINRIDNSKQEMLSEIKELAECVREKHNEAEERLRFLENWRWKIVGGMAVLGFLISIGVGLISFQLTF